MDIKRKAKLFAIDAHFGQIRKGDKEKPMIIHPIDVANKLEKYGFDDNVISAGYLHDVVEDTKYSMGDIERKFGSDVASLVRGDTEIDKSLSWEERKEITIRVIRNLDLRHKAVVCCDKISNLEYLKLVFMINGKEDFSNFKRGFDKQKWYYTEVYNSLICNEDKNLEMFRKLKKLIDYLFYNKREDYLKNVIFQEDLHSFSQLRKLHYEKEELIKLKSFIKNEPYIVEFSGTPRTGKTTLINNLYDFFKKGGFNVEVV